MRQSLNAYHSNMTCYRKYGILLFTTPLSNFMSDEMMSRLFLGLTKHVPNNEWTHFDICCIECNFLKGLYFAVEKALLKKLLQYLLFFTLGMFSFDVNFFM